MNLTEPEWTDKSSMFFNEGEGQAFEKASKSKKFGRGIVTQIRTRYKGKDADLDDKFAEFGANDFYLSLKSPRGYSKEAISLREITESFGERHFSCELKTLVTHAQRAIDEAEKLNF